jgi:hypothetical protein
MHVAVFQDLVVARDAMADHMVHRGADRLGKAVVVQRCRDRLLHIDDVVMADAVELAGADAGLDMGRDHLQHFGGEAPGDAHLFDLVGALDQGRFHQHAATRSWKVKMGSV